MRATVLPLCSPPDANSDEEEEDSEDDNDEDNVVLTSDSTTYFNSFREWLRAPLTVDLRLAAAMLCRADFEQVRA
jgi:hypothetical protein